MCVCEYDNYKSQQARGMKFGTFPFTKFVDLGQILDQFRQAEFVRVYVYVYVFVFEHDNSKIQKARRMRFRIWPLYQNFSSF